MFKVGVTVGPQDRRRGHVRAGFDEYDGEREGEIVIPAGAKAFGDLELAR